jgi:hypothetical protein
MSLAQRNNRFLALWILILYTRIAEIFGMRACFFRNFLPYPSGLWDGHSIHSHPGELVILTKSNGYSHIVVGGTLDVLTNAFVPDP